MFLIKKKFRLNVSESEREREISLVGVFVCQTKNPMQPWVQQLASNTNKDGIFEAANNPNFRMKKQLNIF